MEGFGALVEPSGLAASKDRPEQLTLNDLSHDHPEAPEKHPLTEIPGPNPYLVDFNLAASHALNEGRDAYFRGLTARIAYLGIRGNLVLENSTWVNHLKNAGPVGEQLVGRLNALNANGWSFGALTYNDPFWKLNEIGPLRRLSRFTTLGGYNWPVFEGQPVKRVTYNRNLLNLAAMLGQGYGASTPGKNAATVMAHEIAHSDGILRDHHGSWKKLLPAEQQIMARRLLATEARAVLTQLHIADVIKDTHVHNDIFRSALKKGDLGGFIYDNWGKSGNNYGSFSTITRAEATSFVNRYVSETFGPDLVDRKTGRVRAFNINAGVGQQIGHITGDEALAAKAAEPGAGMKPAQGRLSFLLHETRAGRVLRHAAHGAGGLMLLAMVADVRGAFREGPVAGTGRLARVGVDWGGFEVGTVAGVKAAEKVALLIPRSRLAVKMMPIAAIGGGMVAAYFADKHVGIQAENQIRRAPAYISQLTGGNTISAPVAVVEGKSHLLN